MTAPEPEVLEYGRARRRWPLLAVALLLLAGLAAWLEGARRAGEEVARLAECRDQGLEAVEQAERRLAATATYIAPSLSRARLGLEQSLLRVLGAEAERQSGPVQSALTTCRGVEVWPVNRSRREARSAYVDLLEAEQARLEGIVVDGGAFYSGYDEVQRLRERAEERMAEVGA